MECSLRDPCTCTRRGGGREATIKVLTYNIWMGGRGGAALAEAVRQVDPDVVLVNETPKTPLLSRRRCRRLAESWNMVHAAGGRDAGSNMIAVRPGTVVRSTLTTVIGQPLFQPRRGIAAAQLRVRGRLVGVVTCHLGLDAERRPGEVERVIAVAERLRGPVVIGGDLNEGPRGPSWQRLRAAGYVDHGTTAWPTFPVAEPGKRIDALLVRGDVRVTHHGDPGLPAALLGRASDHRPVLGVLQLDGF